MGAKYSAADIANYFLFKAESDDQELLSNLKLQKLVYYAQGFHLIFFDAPLFKDKIMAWQYGPVVPSLYHTYKQYGPSGIPADKDFDQEVIDEDTREHLDGIYKVFGQFSAIRLMELAHSDQCWKDAGIGNVITHNSMRDSLKKYLKNGKN